MKNMLFRVFCVLLCALCVGMSCADVATAPSPSHDYGGVASTVMKVENPAPAGPACAEIYAITTGRTGIAAKCLSLVRIVAPCCMALAAIQMSPRGMSVPCDLRCR